MEIFLIFRNDEISTNVEACFLGTDDVNESTRSDLTEFSNISEVRPSKNLSKNHEDPIKIEKQF